MNFQELMQRMYELDKPVIEEPNEGNAFSGALDAARDAGQDDFEVDGKTYKVKETDMPEVHPDDAEMDECGMMGGSMMPPPPKQSDSVNMNVSLNASGGGGIRDLMDILRNIEKGGHDHGDMDMDPPSPFGNKEPMIRKMPDMDMLNAETFANEPDEMYGDMSQSIRDGGDLNRAKGQYARAQPGDNPMAVESIKNKLSALYEEIKSR